MSSGLLIRAMIIDPIVNVCTSAPRFELTTTTGVTSGVKIQISGLTMIIAAMLAINGLDMHGWVEGKPTEWNMDT